MTETGENQIKSLIQIYGEKKVYYSIGKLFSGELTENQMDQLTKDLKKTKLGIKGRTKTPTIRINEYIFNQYLNIVADRHISRRSAIEDALILYLTIPTIKRHGIVRLWWDQHKEFMADKRPYSNFYLRKDLLDQLYQQILSENKVKVQNRSWKTEVFEEALILYFIIPKEAAEGMINVWKRKTGQQEIKKQSQRPKTFTPNLQSIEA